jgi:hypothetical protein
MNADDGSHHPSSMLPMGGGSRATQVSCLPERAELPPAAGTWQRAIRRVGELDLRTFGPPKKHRGPTRLRSIQSDSSSRWTSARSAVEMMTTTISAAHVGGRADARWRVSFCCVGRPQV